MLFIANVFNMTKEGLQEKLYNFLEINSNFSLIVIDPHNKVYWEDWLNSIPNILIDFSQLNNVSLEDFVVNLSTNISKILLIKNIDKISETKDKEYWESIITIGLKGEECPITIETKEGYYKTFNLPLDKVKLITTCSQYPEFLKDKGTLGAIFNLS